MQQTEADVTVSPQAVISAEEKCRRLRWLREARAVTGHHPGSRRVREARRHQDAWARGELDLDQLIELLTAPPSRY